MGMGRGMQLMSTTVSLFIYNMYTQKHSYHQSAYFSGLSMQLAQEWRSADFTYFNPNHVVEDCS